MKIGRPDPARYIEDDRCHAGPGTLLYLTLCDTFQTPWLFVRRGVLKPGVGIGEHRHEKSEAMYIILDNAARFIHNGKAADLQGGSMLPCRFGESHGIYNHTNRDTQIIFLAVSDKDRKCDTRNIEGDVTGICPGPAGKLPVRYMDLKLLETARAPIHQGKGLIQFRRIWTHEDFGTNWLLIDHILMPPGTSIGYHSHERMEECYIILAGSGRMTVDGETETVFAGDAIPSKLGGSHGLYNHSLENIEIINMGVSMSKGQIDVENLGDDLAGK